MAIQAAAFQAWTILPTYLLGSSYFPNGYSFVGGIRAEKPRFSSKNARYGNTKYRTRSTYLIYKSKEEQAWKQISRDSRHTTAAWKQQIFINLHSNRSQPPENVGKIGSHQVNPKEDNPAKSARAQS